MRRGCIAPTMKCKRRRRRWNNSMQDGQSSKRNLPDWLPLVVLIALAIFMRLPRLEALDSAPDWLTSHVVLVNRVWQMTGLAANHYSMVTSWPNPVDRHA